MEPFNDSVVAIAARQTALELIVGALVKAHPDKGVLRHLISAASQASFESLLRREASADAAREFAQAHFDRVISNAMALAQDD